MARWRSGGALTPLSPFCATVIWREEKRKRNGGSISVAHLISINDISHVWRSSAMLARLAYVAGKHGVANGVWRHGVWRESKQQSESIMKKHLSR